MNADAETTDVAEGQGSKLYLFLVVLVATVGGFLYGYDSLIISPALIFIKKEFNLSAAETGFAVSSIVLGTFIGTVVSGLVSDALGRKKTLMLSAILFAVSAVGTALPTTILQFNLFRVLGGAGMGIAMVISPVYIAEIAPARIRGALVTLNQFVIVTGAIIAITVAYFLSEREAWRWMMASVIVPIVGLLLGLLFVPESPRWLIEKGRRALALDVLTRTDGRRRALIAAEEIDDAIKAERESKSGGWRELFQPGVRWALAIAVGLAVLQQFSGGMPLSVYAPMIFMKSGFPDPKDAIGIQILFYLYNLLMVAVAMALVERMGRRPLLLFGITGMAIGHFALFFCFKYELWGVYVPVILSVTTGMSNLSISPLAWVIMAEIFPTNVRGKGMALATFLLFCSQFVNNWIFPVMEEFFKDAMGTTGGVFLPYGVLCLLGVLWMWRQVPETKGKTLEQIAGLFIGPRGD